MRVGTWVLMSSLLVGCGGATPSPEWSSEAGQSLGAQPAAMLKDIDAGNFDGLLAKIDKDSIVFDFDSDNNPVRMQGIDQIRQFFAGYKEAMQKTGLSLKSTLVRSDCFATEALGYCAVEF